MLVHLKTIIAKLNVGFLVLFIFLQTSCSTYRNSLSSSESSLKNNNYINSLELIDNNKFLNKKRNRLLYLLEKAKLEHLNKNYRASNQLFEQAYYIVEDRKKNFGANIAAAFTNPETKPYLAEDFEKTTLHYYKALNFFQLGEYDNALVEAKRINIKLNRLNDKYKKKKNKYSEDAFSHIFQGIIYEAKNDINNAFIAYRNAADIYLNNDDYFGISMPNQLKEDLIRTSALLGFSDELRKYQELFNIYDIPDYSNTKSVLFFWENGFGPYKDQTKITLANVGNDTGLGSYVNDDYGIVVPIPVGGYTGITSVAIPKYTERGSYYTKAELISNGTNKSLEPIQNYYQIAKQCLKDRIGREIGETILRVATKKATSKGAEALAGKLGAGWLGKKLAKLGVDAIGAALEKADTRNWQTLPNKIYYTRIPVAENESTITLKLHHSVGSTEKSFTLSDSKQLEVINFASYDRVNNNQQLVNSGNTSQKIIGLDSEKRSNSTNSQYVEQDFTKSSQLNTTKRSYILNKNNSDIQKSKLFGFGARYSMTEHEDISYNTIEPEITFYNNDKRLGFSFSYGFQTGEVENYSFDEYIYFESLSKFGSNFLLGFSNSLGLVLEGQYSSGFIYTEDFDFTGFDYEAYGGGIGVFYKGNGMTNLTSMGKLIFGYNGSEFFGGGLYLTGGLNILF